MIYLLRKGLFLSLPLPKKCKPYQMEIRIYPSDQQPGSKLRWKGGHTKRRHFHEYLPCFSLSFTAEGLIPSTPSAPAALRASSSHAAGEQGTVSFGFCNTSDCKILRSSVSFLSAGVYNSNKGIVRSKFLLIGVTSNPE